MPGSTSTGVLDIRRPRCACKSPTRSSQQDPPGFRGGRCCEGLRCQHLEFLPGPHRDDFCSPPPGHLKGGAADPMLSEAKTGLSSSFLHTLGNPRCGCDAPTSLSIYNGFPRRGLTKRYASGSRRRDLRAMANATKQRSSKSWRTTSSRPNIWFVLSPTTKGRYAVGFG